MTLAVQDQPTRQPKGGRTAGTLEPGTDRALAFSRAGQEAKAANRKLTEVDLAKRSLRRLLTLVAKGEAPVTAQSLPMLIRACADVVRLDQREQENLTREALASKLAVMLERGEVVVSTASTVDDGGVVDGVAEEG